MPSPKMVIVSLSFVPTRETGTTRVSPATTRVSTTMRRCGRQARAAADSDSMRTRAAAPRVAGCRQHALRIRTVRQGPHAAPTAADTNAGAVVNASAPSPSTAPAAPARTARSMRTTGLRVVVARLAFSMWEMIRWLAASITTVKFSAGGAILGTQMVAWAVGTAALNAVRTFALNVSAATEYPEGAD